LRKHQKIGYRDLIDKFVGEIEAGVLIKGASLPSSRDLAVDFGISRDTVVRCYRYLQDHAYITSDGPRGSFVSYEHPSNPQPDAAPPLDQSRLSNFGRLYLEERGLNLFLVDFPRLNYGAVPREYLPVKRWRELMQLHSKPNHFRSLNYETETLGRSELRRAISSYLQRSKNLLTVPEQIAVFSISVGAVELLCRLLLSEGDVIAVENPGFGGIKNIAAYRGLEVVPIDIDREGLIVQDLDRLERTPKLIYVTPNSQDPSGIQMTLSRRTELIEWCKKNRAWLIEDDFDGFYLHGKAQLPSLYSLDAAGNVIYISTFWQVLYPLTTTGFILAPQNLMAVIEKSKAHTHGIPETMVQLTLADMLDSGYLQKHVRLTGKTFGSRLRAFCYQAKRLLGEQISINRQCAGLNCLINLPAYPLELVLRAADAAELPLVSTQHFYSKKSHPTEYLVNFAAISEEQSKNALQKFVQILRNNEKEPVR